MHDGALGHVHQPDQHLLAVGAHRRDVDADALAVLLDHLAQAGVVALEDEAEVALVLEVVEELHHVLLVLRVVLPQLLQQRQLLLPQLRHHVV